ncbi:MAG: 23S rRNA (adenine(2503)-C(2))-methyltransferase RlmN [Lachnospiraceae bacterium]|nr:23S rRNA (adenine(2503)-C(2))-methyltransferase RlmN [Lachnospiraceae bacterium]
MEKADIKSMTLPQLQEFVEELGEKKFRAGQLYQWMHQKLVTQVSQMTNLPAEFRKRLEEETVMTGCRMIERQTAEDGTCKFLMELSDGNTIETVRMKYHHGNSVCISTQVGCRMGCRFCASTVGGLVRSLTCSEMLEQIYEVQRVTGERVSNVILMGIGEPLDNYDNVVRFIRMLSDEHGLHISQRNITVSTCGLVDGIHRLMEEDLAITLAISLHAPGDKLRREMMPVANRFSIDEIIDACRKYFEKTGRRVTFEYSLVDGKNDGKEHAIELAALLKGMNCHVNLIPLNPVEGRMGERSKRTNVLEFKKILEKYRINSTIRREMGSDIDAACGQLRNKHKGGETT